MAERRPLISVEQVVKTYAVRSGLFGRRHLTEAVRGVSFDIPRGLSVGLVGESGSGKTTIARMILGLTSLTEGQVRFAGEDSGDRFPRLGIQAVFQDPFTSLDPHQSTFNMLDELQRVRFTRSRADRTKRSKELLDAVGLSDREGRALPQELSGGQRQRVAIARALCSEPSVIVLDEAVSALDVSVQAQILNLLSDLKEAYSLTYLVISHDLAVINHLCDSVIVLYHGVCLEQGPTTAVLTSPKSPYTQMLLKSAPHPGMVITRWPTVQQAQLVGCPFRDRCPIAAELCAEIPPLRELPSHRSVRCWLADAAEPLPPSLPPTNEL